MIISRYNHKKNSTAEDDILNERNTAGENLLRVRGYPSQEKGYCRRRGTAGNNVH